MMKEPEIYQRSEKRVEEKLGFYTHLAVYIVVNLFLIALNLSTSPESYWFQWTLLGWGIGLLFHGLNVFIFSGGLGIKDKMIEKEMKKEGSKL